LAELILCDVVPPFAWKHLHFKQVTHIPGCAADSSAEEDAALDVDQATVTGDGSPPGSHYNLNIIGVDSDKRADMNNTSGHSLFVDLKGGTKIKLGEGDFTVVDRNGTDGEDVPARRRAPVVRAASASSPRTPITLINREMNRSR
jgi:hypothetical protein